MKKTNVELLEFFGLKVGDKIKVEGYNNTFVILEESGIIFTKREICSSGWDYYDIGLLTNVLLNNEYEVVKPKKKLGEMKCSEMSCSKCPLRAIDCDITNNITNSSMTLYEALERYRKYLSGLDDPLKHFEKTFIDAIKAELDKEMQECEK